MEIARGAAPAHRSSAVRPGPLGLLREAFAEVVSRRRLAGYLVQADLRKKGADTLLGNLWWVLDPLLQMAMYVVLVAVIFQRQTPDYPLFLFAAILPWKWFSSTVNDAITSVSSQDRLIKQIQFPKIVLPTASTLAGVVSFLFGLIPLVAILVLVYPHRISPTLALIPVVAFVQIVFSLAVAYVLAAVNVFYRDVGNLARHALRIWFYLSPGLYALEEVTRITDGNPTLATLYSLNPFVTLFESYRDVIYAGTPPDWLALGGLLLGSTVLLLLTTWLFKVLEPSFAKVL